MPALQIGILNVVGTSLTSMRSHAGELFQFLPGILKKV